MLFDIHKDLAALRRGVDEQKKELATVKRQLASATRLVYPSRGVSDLDPPVFAWSGSGG